MDSDLICGASATPVARQSPRPGQEAQPTGRQTPEPGRRTPLHDRWVDIHVDRGHVCTQVDTLLACGYGRGVFQSRFTRPPQRQGRYQMQLDANGEVLRSTLNTLRTGITSYEEAFRNPADYEEYVRQLDLLLWDRVEEQRVGYQIDNRLDVHEERVRYLDEIDALFKDIKLDIPPVVRRRVGELFIDACVGEKVEVRGGEERRLSHALRDVTLYFRALGITEFTFEEKVFSENTPCKWTRILCEITLPPAIPQGHDAQTTAALHRLCRFQRACAIVKRRFRDDRGPSKAFVENAGRIGAAYARTGFGESVSLPLVAEVTCWFDDVPQFEDLPTGHLRHLVELLGATDIAFPRTIKDIACAFKMPPA